MTFKIEISLVLWLKWTQTMEMKQNHIFFHGTYSNMTPYNCLSKILNYSNDFQNRNFSVLWLKWTQTMQMKQNQTFFHGTYSNLTLYLFLSKNIKVFRWLSKSKSFSFMIKVNPNNANETKSGIFPRYIFKSDIIFHWLENIKIFQWLL